MIKDVYLRILFIPLLGVVIPFISGIITYKLYSVPELIASNLFFILTSFVIWMGSYKLHVKIRPLYTPSWGPFPKIITVSASTALYGVCIGSISSLIWYKFSHDIFTWNNFYKFIAVCVAAVLVFTLVYEILFLTKERELDSQLVDEMDKELTQAEMLALTNEMDPHFIFNSLNAMSHLILSNPMQAHLFNNNLAQVFKYFLKNKNQDLIPLKDELAFIDNYFFLLQIRYENKLQLQTDLNSDTDTVFIPPCAIQVLIENAIKHNEFSSENPLHIKIHMNRQYLVVANNVRPKPHSVNSTNIGLKNLSSRFKITCRKDISIQKNHSYFSVTLPVIKKT
jgi:two-component system, LytTR family, sensor kinase